MEIILIASSIFIFLLGSASYIHRARQTSFLTKNLQVDQSLINKTAKELGVDGAAVAGISTFDVLYNTLKLEPNALKGMTHLHQAQDFENLGDLMSFMKDNIIKSEFGDAAYRQMIHKYKGYTGEETSFENLTQKGYALNIPESGTTKGLDVEVDGVPYNVKVTDNPRYIQEHLDKHPDIDVIANKEMADAFANNPRVIIDYDLSSQESFHQTLDTFDGISNIGSSFDNIPYIALGINTLKSGHRLCKGEIGFKTATEHVALDTAGASVGILGAKAGLTLGLALAPVTGGISAVVIPVASSMVGAFLGVLGGKGATGWIKSRHHRAAIEKLKEISIEFRDNFIEKFSEITTSSNDYYNKIIYTSNENIKKEGFFKRMLFPTSKTTFYRLAKAKISEEQQNNQAYYKDVYEKIKQGDPSEAGLMLYSQGVNILCNVDPLPSLYANIQAQMVVVEEERRKLG